MLAELIQYARDAIYRAQQRLEPGEEHVIIKDGEILSEPPHDEEIDPNAEADAFAKTQAIANYEKMAKELCAKNKREGVWIELLLLGVQISSIKDGTLDGNQFHFRLKSKPIIVTVPEWCLDMMNQDDINWQMDRKTIHRGFGKLEIVPEDVFKLSPNYEL